MPGMLTYSQLTPNTFGMTAEISNDCLCKFFFHRFDQDELRAEVDLSQNVEHSHSELVQQRPQANRRAI